MREIWLWWWGQHRYRRLFEQEYLQDAVKKAAAHSREVGLDPLPMEDGRDMARRVFEEFRKHHG